jgi:leader peptidase (prepilin peptidase)/N-methyltransferase
VIGSFLNVVIWRLPRGKNLSHPGSHCPNCGHKISALENIPFLSFLALRARCRGCKNPISWRYPGVELLTALVFLAIVWKFGGTVQSVAYCLFSAALIAAFFIDLELFLIPDELNTFALFCGFSLDLFRISQHGTAALKWGWLPPSVFGAVVCAGVFVAIQLLGYGLFRKEAMGEGDVKLARAIGALLPLQQALVSFFLAVAVGAVVGIGRLVFLSTAGRLTPEVEEAENESSNEEEEDDEYGAGYIVLSGLMYLVFLDLAAQCVDFFKRVTSGQKKKALTDEEDDFVATPGHIPYGPFMVAG